VLSRPPVLAAFALLASVAASGLAGCEDVNHGDIADEINILVKRNDELVPPAVERLTAFRRTAIPQIETALHTAAPPGRLHLLTALEAIGDPAAIPVLRHVALFDVTSEVRDAAEAALRRWGSGPPASRAARANDALAEVARKRANGIGPLLFGGNGVPGVPSTVGAPEPIGPTAKP
jgi:hypothetical protein